MQTAYALSPTDMVRHFRSTYVSFHVAWRISGVPEGAELSVPTERPIAEIDMQPSLRDAIAEYQESVVGSTLRLEKFLRYKNGRLVLVVEDETPLPDERHFVAFSQTSTRLTMGTAEILTELVVGRLRDPR